ncbi:MAG: hypothetical protein CMQ61_12825 [Gammaproteobacteria bacterium]|nr:hypothetical protein [Gammaproteobacteria bacterium]
MRNLRRLAAGVLVVAAASLAGCSVASVFYGQVDWVVTDYIADLAELRSEQRAQLAERLREVHAWHRRDELPRYRALLDDAIGALDRGLTVAETEALYERGRERYRLLMARVGTAVAPTLVDLDMSQIEVLERNLSARNEEFKEDFAASDPEERKARRRERMEERFERLTGDLNDQQLADLGRRSDEFPDSGQLWLDYRVAQQIRLLGMLKTGKPASVIEAQLRDWFSEGLDRGARLDALSAELERRLLRTVVAVVNSLDKAQSAYLREQLGDFSELAMQLNEDS